jgi:hypothetical protein
MLMGSLESSSITDDWDFARIGVILLDFPSEGRIFEVANRMSCAECTRSDRVPSRCPIGRKVVQ